MLALETRVQVRPAGLDAETDRFTVPVNPFSAVTVIVDVPEAPARTSAGVTVPAEMLKSAWGVKVTLTV